MTARGLLISALMSASLLAGCQPWAGGASQPVQPSDSGPVPAHGVMADPKASETTAAQPPAQADAPAMMNPVQPNDIVGSWQMVQLPPSFLQPTQPTAPFNNPWQWFIFSPLDATGTGRVGIVSRVEPPQGTVTDQALADAWAASPMFDTYRMNNGTMAVTPVAITGWSAQGTQNWRVYSVTNAGLMLGMRAIPGDVLMILTSPDNRPLYYRMLRRVQRVQP
ncbi:MAG: hypothetical protein JNL25_13530 [Rhodospirillaceae bacterium]|nr:hypothetical protein [Rhodospirillaceae bacterium]